MRAIKPRPALATGLQTAQQRPAPPRSVWVAHQHPCPGVSGLQARGQGIPQSWQGCAGATKKYSSHQSRTALPAACGSSH